MSRTLPQTIAIDGPAASGKTTVGLAIAAKHGYAFLDTGLMYRAVALAALRTKTPPTADAARRLLKQVRLEVEVSPEGTRIRLDGEVVTDLLRNADVEAAVSEFAAIPEVREAMVRQQREVASRGKAVLAGRDIGTVVLPDAPLKLYFDANEEARAKRRGAQSTQKDTEARRDISKRDRIDSDRTVSPLRPAEDAIIIDTTEMTLDEVVKLALEKVSCAAG